MTPHTLEFPANASTKLATFAGDIKIAHTVFALPFALLSAFIAAGGWPKAGMLGLILVCMVTARTVAMAANRLVDAPLDALNPRTARRAIPSGALSRTFVGSALSLCAVAFIGSTSLFWVVYRNPWPLRLAAPVLLFLGAYPFLKRFTRLCHYYLGMALALAPICAWIAIRGDLRWPPIIMAAAVLSWTAGFDIIYACQDYAVDVACGLFSVPAKNGIAKALWVARVTHGVSAGMLIALGVVTPQLGVFYFVGVGAAVVLLVVEHSLVRAEDLSKVNIAFFTVNGVMSVILGSLGIVSVIVKR